MFLSSSASARLHPLPPAAVAAATATSSTVGPLSKSPQDPLLPSSTSPGPSGNLEHPSYFPPNLLALNHGHDQSALSPVSSAVSLPSAQPVPTLRLPTSWTDDSASTTAATARFAAPVLSQPTSQIPPLTIANSSIRSSPSSSPHRKFTTGSRLPPPAKPVDRRSPGLPSTPPVLLQNSTTSTSVHHSDQSYIYNAALPSQTLSPFQTIPSIVPSSSQHSVNTVNQSQDAIKAEALHHRTWSNSMAQPHAAAASADTRRPYHAANGSRSGHGFTTDMRQPAAPRESSRSGPQRAQDRDRKSILDRALQKAHTAVVLDNNNNIEGAIEAYTDACELLHQVLVRSTVPEERGKLEQIRETYSLRVQELLEQTKDSNAMIDKMLPARPTSDESIQSNGQYSGPSESEAQVEAVNTTKLEPLTSSQPSRVLQPVAAVAAPESSAQTQIPRQLNLEKLPALTSPMDPQHIPKPLSPRRIEKSIDSSSQPASDQLLQPPVGVAPQPNSSWLGPIGSNTSSASSSVHSLVEGNLMGGASPQTYYDAETDFDAALDAAVEAAYDDGFEPFTYEETTPVAKQYLTQKHSSTSLAEDRNLDEFSKDRELDGFDFGLQKSNLPRQSDSSGYSGSTWHSSSTSSRATGSISLTTVAEGPDAHLGPGGKLLGSLPRLSEEQSRSDSPSFNDSKGQLPKSQSGSVRSRRMSGQNTKQLKIETQSSKQPNLPNPTNQAIKEEPTSGIKSAGTSHTDLSLEGYRKQQQNGFPFQQVPLSAGSRPIMSPSDTALTISPATPGLSLYSTGENSPGRLQGTRPSYLRKNKSSLSLRNRALSVSSPDGSDGSLATPMSTTSMTRKINQHMLPPPILPDSTHLPMHIFKSDIHSPMTPGFPNPNMTDGPIPLEPCPEPVVLRPFWLLRCIYQTIANPNGGYISNRLFVPREAWSTKGVKLKNVEEKISQLDFLTNALNRLGQVDSFDAEAVEKEMQSLELVLDAVQAVLAKKLGHEVGVNATASFIKDAPLESGSQAAGQSEVHYPNSRSSSKSYLSSWRKLRSKTSSTHLPNGHHKENKENKDKTDANAPKLSSVPMTTALNVNMKFTRKKEVLSFDVSGPWAGYMSSLAKFCDAVQIVDRIARQVEDPGLKKSSQAYFGLELSTRHASEFFGLYVCRWVLADLGLLLDKFVKRSTEWVLL